MFAGLSELLQRLPVFAASIGVWLLVVGAAVYLALWLGIVPGTVSGLQLYEIVPLVLTVGAGSLIAGAAFKLPVAWKTVRYAFRKARKRAEVDRQTDGNLKFLGDDERLLLLAFIKVWDGRLPPLREIRPLVRLYEFGMLESESGFVSYNGIPNGVLLVRPSLMNGREPLHQELTTWASEKYECDMSDKRTLDAKCVEVFQRHGVY